MEEKFFRVLLGGLMASSVPRGRPLEPGYFRPGGDTVNQDCTHLHVEKSDEPSPHIPLSPEDEWQTERPAAYAGAKVTGSFRNQREKDEIRQERPVLYLTQAAGLAKPPAKLATLTPKMATLNRDFGNPNAITWQPCTSP
jgi:hypothetical protein